MSAKIKYKNPPIIERVIGVYADIDPNLFEIKMPEWALKIRDFYPLSRPITEWRLDIQNVNGVPMLKDSLPQAEIIQLFWKPHPQKSLVYGMRLRPSRLVFHLGREEDDVHDFDEIFKEMENWIWKWMEHFEVKTLKGVTAEYVNQLNAKYSPEFILPNGGLRISDAFRMFTNIPGKYTSIIPPFDSRLRLVVDEKMPCYFDLRVRADDDPRVGVRIDFTTSTIQQNNKSISAKEALEEIQFAHSIIIEQFDCLFTDLAKKSFIPYGIPDK